MRDVLDLARRRVGRDGRPAAADPRWRQRLAQSFIETDILRGLAYKNVTEIMRNGQSRESIDFVNGDKSKPKGPDSAAAPSAQPPQASNDVNRPATSIASNKDVHKTAALADTRTAEAMAAASPKAVAADANPTLPIDFGPNGKTIDVP